MITAEDVVEVSRTGTDHAELSLVDLVRMTGQKDWDGPGLYRLKFEAASEIAAVINTNNHVSKPQANGKRRGRRKIEETSAGVTDNGDA